MSILKVDTINEKTSGNGIEIAHALKGSGIAGNIVQMVEQQGNGSSSQGFGTSTAYSSNSYTNIDHGSITITPKFATSKILILMSTHIYVLGYSVNAWRGANIRIQRGSTDISTDGNGYGTTAFFENDTDRYMTHQARFVIDAPNTTSAVTYQAQVASKVSGQTVHLNRSDYGAGGFLSALEIAQ